MASLSSLNRSTDIKTSLLLLYMVRYIMKRQKYNHRGSKNNHAGTEIQIRLLESVISSSGQNETKLNKKGQ